MLLLCRWWQPPRRLLLEIESLSLSPRLPLSLSLLPIPLALSPSLSLSPPPSLSLSLSSVSSFDRITTTCNEAPPPTDPAFSLTFLTQNSLSLFSLLSAYQSRSFFIPLAGPAPSSFPPSAASSSPSAATSSSSSSLFFPSSPSAFISFSLLVAMRLMKM